MISPKLLSFVLSVAVFHAPLSLPLIFPGPAQAIPKSAAIAKLKTLNAYVIVQSDDEFVFTQQDDTKLVSVFLDKSNAETLLAAFKKNDRKFKGTIKKYTLDQLFPIIEQSSLQSSSGDSKLLFAIVNDKYNTENAFKILRTEGLSRKEIEKNLRVPVFFTEPMINLEIPSAGKKQVFFTNYSFIESVLTQLPTGTPKPKLKVLNLDQVIQLIIDNRKDIYYIFSNE